MKKIKNALRSFSVAISLTHGADQQETHTQNALTDCVTWFASKFTAGAALERGMAYPTKVNLTDLWRVFGQTGHEHLIPKTVPPSDQ